MKARAKMCELSELSELSLLLFLERTSLVGAGRNQFLPLPSRVGNALSSAFRSFK
jgi:hypothetical protein